MFYIFDTNKNIVGNIKGYRTIKGAIREAENNKSKAHKAICQAFEVAKNSDKRQHRLVYSVGSI